MNTIEKLKLSVGGIPAIQTLWDKKKVMLNLTENSKKFGEYRKMSYKKDSWHCIAEIGILESPEYELFIDIDTYHEGKISSLKMGDIRRVRISERQILLLAEKIKELKKIPKKEWRIN